MSSARTNNMQFIDYVKLFGPTIGAVLAIWVRIEVVQASQTERIEQTQQHAERLEQELNDLKKIVYIIERIDERTKMMDERLKRSEKQIDDGGRTR